MTKMTLPDSNIQWHRSKVSKADRAKRLGQKPGVIWFTGLSGSGKSSLADALESQLFGMGYSTYLLDGDNLRHGLCCDLGFSESDRAENMRRAGEVARLLVDAGHIVIACFISPFARERRMVREVLAAGAFMEVYVSTPLSVCEQRDPKGLYGKVRAGLIRNFTGIDSAYEPPADAELELDMSQMKLDEAVAELLLRLRESGQVT